MPRACSGNDRPLDRRTGGIGPWFRKGARFLEAFVNGSDRNPQRFGDPADAESAGAKLPQEFPVNGKRRPSQAFPRRPLASERRFHPFALPGAFHAGSPPGQEGHHLPERTSAIEPRLAAGNEPHSGGLQPPEERQKIHRIPRNPIRRPDDQRVALEKSRFGIPQEALPLG